MSKQFIQQYPDGPVRFLKAIAVATLFYGQNKEMANKWFAEDARIEYNSPLLDEAASIDSNINASSINELELGLS